MIPFIPVEPTVSVNYWIYWFMFIFAVFGVIWTGTFFLFIVWKKIRFPNEEAYIKYRIEYYQKELKELQEEQTVKETGKVISRNISCEFCGYVLTWKQKLFSIGIYGIRFTCPYCGRENLHEKIKTKREGPLY